MEKNKLTWTYIGKTIYKQDNLEVKVIGHTKTDHILQIIIKTNGISNKI